MTGILTAEAFDKIHETKSHIQFICVIGLKIFPFLGLSNNTFIKAFLATKFR